ncbi:MAG: hypothetical protein JXQ90_19660 [Cyclobacteriaceae bacterium]
MSDQQDLLDRFSYNQGRRDQGPNRQLAQEIATGLDYDLLGHVIELLSINLKKQVENDVLLCLATLSEQAPEMLKTHAQQFIPFLHSKNNRSVWGTMIVLSNIAPLCKKEIYDALPTILKCMDEGTVVTRDHGFEILLHLYQDSLFVDEMYALIREQIWVAPDNQLGQYTEKFLVHASPQHLEELLPVLNDRQQQLEKVSHIKRLSKLTLRIQRQLT